MTTAIVSGFTPRQARGCSRVLAYAELKDAADSPVRTYSEGTKLRLAFAVVAELRPTALLLDEAMTVGDLSFQHKPAARCGRRGGWRGGPAGHRRPRAGGGGVRSAAWLEQDASTAAARLRRSSLVRAATMDETARRTPGEQDDGGGVPGGARRLGSQEATIEDVVLYTARGSGPCAAMRPARDSSSGGRSGAGGPPAAPVVAVVIRRRWYDLLLGDNRARRREAHSFRRSSARCACA